jgi:death-on-curing protein
VLNGLRLEATDAELVVAIVALAGGELSDEELAHWFRERVAQRG